MIKETLTNIGMTKNEITIYLTLLNKTELSVNDISRKSGLHRQVCYDTLNRLLEKGFVSYISKNNKKYFKSLKPAKIVEYIEEQKQEVQAILPKLNALFVEQSETTQVEIIKGKNVIRTICNDIISTLRKTKGTLYVMGVDESKFIEFDKIAIEQYISRMKRYKLKEKLLTRKNAAQYFTGPQSQYRFIADELFNPNPTHVYGDKIAMVVWGHPTYGIIIQSRQLADANRNYFEILWKSAKKR